LGRRLAGHFVTYGAVAGLWLFADRSRRVRAAELAASDLAAKLADARLDALRAQLNPHFLFNALNSVSSLVRRARGDDALRAIVRLSALLRRALDDMRPSIGTLAEEFELCEQYLQLEQVRFSDRLTYAIAIDPGTADTACPAFLLQPLVENAVHHGVSRHSGPSTIRITSERVGESVRVVIWNSGASLSATPTDGVGLANTRARLRWVHGERASIALGKLEGGVAATVEWPVA
jgi:LytS/YehU family sensor histidine kinase